WPCATETRRPCAPGSTGTTPCMMETIGSGALSWPGMERRRAAEPAARLPRASVRACAAWRGAIDGQETRSNPTEEIRMTADPDATATPRTEVSPAPSAVRTFLIADVRGYTRFTQQHGDEAAARLATRFAALAREVVGAWGGQVLELRGDEALAVFISAR